MSLILFREDTDNREELKIAKKYFDVYTNRCSIPPFNYVIGRYSVLPYYKELVRDLRDMECDLINDHKQHSFIANISEWYPYLEKYTFKTWFDSSHIPLNAPGAFVVKGNVNSRKHSWNNKMFASNRTMLGFVMYNLIDDPLISDQGMCIRQYEELETYMIGLNGLPITNEHRIFIANKKIVSYGYYWANYHIDVIEKLGKLPSLDQFPEAWKLINEVKSIVDEHASFYVIDVARKKDGNWVLVELNDAQMSGLSTIDPDNFYKSLGNVLNEHKDKKDS